MPRRNRSMTPGKSIRGIREPEDYPTRLAFPEQASRPLAALRFLRPFVLRCAVNFCTRPRTRSSRQLSYNTGRQGTTVPMLVWSGDLLDKRRPYGVCGRPYLSASPTFSSIKTDPSFLFPFTPLFPLVVCLFHTPALLRRSFRRESPWLSKSRKTTLFCGVVLAMWTTRASKTWRFAKCFARRKPPNLPQAESSVLRPRRTWTDG